MDASTRHNAAYLPQRGPCDRDRRDQDQQEYVSAEETVMRPCPRNVETLAIFNCGAVQPSDIMLFVHRGSECHRARRYLRVGEVSVDEALKESRDDT